jgi:preprotein translocase subunit SecG
MVLEDILKVVQMLISVLLIVLVVLQGKGSNVGQMLGGSEGAGITKTRRGLEKTLFQVTIVLAALFLANAIAQLLIS